MQGVGHRIAMAAQPLHRGFTGQHAEQSEQCDDRSGWAAHGNQALDHADAETGEQRNCVGLPSHVGCASIALMLCRIAAVFRRRVLEVGCCVSLDKRLILAVWIS